MPGGLAAFDYDNDGRTDLFFTNGAEVPSLVKRSPRHWNRLYRNEGGLRFADVTERAGLAGEGYAMGAAAGDYDNDGHVDLFVAGVDRNHLYRNTGERRFEDVTRKAGLAGGLWSVAAGWLDFDADGLLDLFVVNYVRWSPGDSRFCGDRARGIRVYCHPQYFEGTPNSLYRNRGDGTFEDVSERAGIARHVGKGMSVAVADYDEDGRLDVFVPNDTSPSFLFRNLGDGCFEETALLAGVALPEHGRAISAMGAEFRDYDNDGRPDVHVTALAGETFPLFRNEGGGQFSDRTLASGLVAATLRRSGWGNVLADLDNDGRLDVVTTALGDRVEIWRNETTTGNRWLALKLTGRRSNRDGIGARIRLGPQIQTVTTCAGYASSAHAGVHFGVGTAERIERIEITWPSGVVQVLEDVGTNQVLTVREPEK